MQIQLKQADIEQAIKNHIAAIGIQREVDEINFTMGRKSSGLVADIVVSDRVNVKPASDIAITRDVEKAQEVEAVDVDASEAVTEAADNDTDEEVAEEPVLREEVATTSSEKSSLFGS